MANEFPPTEKLLEEIQALRNRLFVAEDTLRAIQRGDIDALVIATPGGERVFTLQSADYTYRLLVEQMQEGAATLTTEGYILYNNYSLANLLQESQFDLVGAEFQRFVAPFDLPIFQHLLSVCQEQGLGSGECCLINHQGRLIPVFLSINQLTITQAPIYSVVVTDLTEQKRNETILRQSEEQFRSAFDYAPVGIALVGLDGHWLKVNSTLCQIVGYTEAELLATTSQAVTHPADLDIDRAYIQQVLQEDLQAGELKKRYLHQQGQAIWVRLRASPVRDSQGVPQHFVFQIEDITQQQAIEQLKRDFISIVSHEIRTPLTAIHGSLGLLAHGLYDNRPDKLHQMLQIAATQTDRLVRLVNDILSLERMESGKVTMLKTACEVAPLMQQAVESMRSIAEQKHIQLALVPLNAKVWANADAIIQTLTNLISNAIKFSPEHSTVTVQAKQVAAKASVPATPVTDLQTTLPSGAAPLSSFVYALFSVADQGRGVPPNKLDTIFEQFQQVDASDAREKGGTGLGLAICRSIVQRHNGHIWVDSTLGQGSTFYFTLPLSSDKFPMLEE